MRWGSRAPPPTGWRSCPTDRSSRRTHPTSSSPTRNRIEPGTSSARSFDTEGPIMRFTRTTAVLGVVALGLSLAACGGDSTHADVDVADEPTFDEGTTMAELSDAGTIKIGVKVDQP